MARWWYQFKLISMSSSTVDTENVSSSVWYSTGLQHQQSTQSQASPKNDNILVNNGHGEEDDSNSSSAPPSSHQQTASSSPQTSDIELNNNTAICISNDVNQQSSSIEQVYVNGNGNDSGTPQPLSHHDMQQQQHQEQYLLSAGTYSSLLNLRLPSGSQQQIQQAYSDIAYYSDDVDAIHTYSQQLPHALHSTYTHQALSPNSAERYAAVAAQDYQTAISPTSYEYRSYRPMYGTNVSQIAYETPIDAQTLVNGAYWSTPEQYYGTLQQQQSEQRTSPTDSSFHQQQQQ
ncbi:unnamed protein product, partial [Didymodactylos carnosus]